MPRIHWNSDNVARLKQYRDQGIPRREIARLFATTDTTIKQALKRLANGTIGQYGPKQTKPQHNPFITTHFRKASDQRAYRRPSANDNEAIRAFIATHGVRRFESGASGEHHNAITWLRVVCGIKVEIVIKDGRARPFHMGGRKMSPAEFFRFVDQQRAKRNLEPLKRVA